MPLPLTLREIEEAQAAIYRLQGYLERLIENGVQLEEMKKCFEPQELEQIARRARTENGLYVVSDILCAISLFSYGLKDQVLQRRGR